MAKLSLTYQVENRAFLELTRATHLSPRIPSLDKSANSIARENYFRYGSGRNPFQVPFGSAQNDLFLRGFRVRLAASRTTLDPLALPDRYRVRAV